MKRQPTVAEVILFVSGVVMLLFSFFDFWGIGSFGENAWGASFPLTTYASIFGGAIAVLIALAVFAGTKLPDRVLGFSWPQLFFMASVFAFLLMFGFLVGDIPDLKIGGIMNFLGSIGLVVGSTMTLLGKGTESVNLGGSKPASGA
jgi:hypothetical protein